MLRQCCESRQNAAILDYGGDMGSSVDEAQLRLGTHMEDLRSERHLSQHDLAELSGVSITTIGNIEHGRHRPRTATLKKLATALGVDVDDLRLAARWRHIPPRDRKLLDLVHQLPTAERTALLQYLECRIAAPIRRKTGRERR